jgi:sugar/nucleoside kinase (ribokinase family)
VCTPQELENCRRALSLVDVVSPNHAEIAFFFQETGELNGEVDRTAAERHARDWLSSGIGVGGSGGIVIRCGKEGCLVASRSITKWLPAYHSDGDKVVDPTGGGNAFLGGMSIALARSHGLEEAAIWGSIAASFAIEQIGVPELESGLDGETWNRDSVNGRLENFISRIR